MASVFWAEIHQAILSVFSSLDFLALPISKTINVKLLGGGKYSWGGY